VHVPYRNSLMTLVLKDSLGGNCRTVMVAAISADAAQMEESISTCRFAQRVAMVTNEVRPGWLAACSSRCGLPAAHFQGLV
jgi:kinesin family protein 6/9